MTGRRKKDHHLPLRVYCSKGWHWYVDLNGKWHRLGRQWGREARQKWMELSEGQAAGGTVAKLLDEFLAWADKEVRAGKRAVRTHEDNLVEAQELKQVFGAFPAHHVTRRHVARYLDERSAPVRANREISLLSSAFSWALRKREWEMVTANPCYGVRRNTETPRNNYVESRELVRFGKHCGGWLRTYLVLKRISGLRQGDLLQLMKPQPGSGWVRAYIGKTKKPAKLKISWGVEVVLRAIEADHKAREIDSLFLFPNSRTGGPLSSRGFKSAWARAKEDWKGQAFTEHDVRGKASSDAPSLEEAQKLMAHQSPATTARHYRAGVVKIRPRR